MEDYGCCTWIQEVTAPYQLELLQQYLPTTGHSVNLEFSAVGFGFLNITEPRGIQQYFLLGLSFSLCILNSQLWANQADVMQKTNQQELLQLLQGNYYLTAMQQNHTLDSLF